jgi:hypothetical protein
MRSARRLLRLGYAAALLAIVTACSGGGAAPTARSAPRTPRSTPSATSHPTPSPTLTTPNLPTEQASVEPEPTVGADVDLRRYLVDPPPGTREFSLDAKSDHWMTVAEIARLDYAKAKAIRQERSYLRSLGVTGAAVMLWQDKAHRTIVYVQLERFPSPGLALIYRGDQTTQIIDEGGHEPGLLLPPHTILYDDPRHVVSGTHIAYAGVNDHNVYITVFVMHVGKTLPALARRISQQQVRRLDPAFGTAT